MDSQRMNEALITYLDRRDIPTPFDADRRLHDWGEMAQHSAAAHPIIAAAHAIPEGEKLTVTVLGANTNIVSALLIDPTIPPKIKVYLLGTGYDFESQIWTKRDFNCVMDIQAIEVVLNQPELEFHIIPVNVAAALKFDADEIKDRRLGLDPTTDYLHQISLHHSDGVRLRRTIWDLAIISCSIDPSFGEQITVTRPLENGGTPVPVYRLIDGEAIRAEFYAAVKVHFSKN